MAIAIYPGSFDPVTKGHEDVIERAAAMFDKLIIGILTNAGKQPTFSVQERVDMIAGLYKNVPNIEVKSFDGLTIDFAREEGASVIVRGLRAVTDFEYELQLAQTNKVLAPDIDTVFLTTNLNYSYLSSSIVKEIASYGGDISKFLSPDIKKLVEEKYGYKNGGAK